MIKLNLVLLAIVIGCALGVVTAQHQTRESYMALQRRQAQAKQIEVEWGRLQLEQSTWAMHSRIEKIATGYLHMFVPDPSQVRLVTVIPPAMGVRR